MKWFVPMSGCLLLMLATASFDRADEPADKVQAALRQSVSLEFDNLTLDQCAERLRTLTKLNVSVHESLRPVLEAREQRLQAGEGAAVGVPPPPMSDAPVQERQPFGFSCSLRHLPLGTSLRIFLDHYGLGHAVVGDSFVIALADKAQQMQRTQPVALNFDNTPLAKAVDDLAGRYGVALVVDAQAAKEAKTPITLAARDVSLEEAVHLLADAVNLKAAPLKFGWLLTTAEKAREWQARRQRAGDAEKPRTTPAGGAIFGGGIDPGALGGGLGGIGNLDAIEVPLALLQVAGPPPRVGQAAGKTPPAASPAHIAEPKKSLAAETQRKMQELFDSPNNDPMALKDAIQIMEQNGFPRIVIHHQTFKDENAEVGDISESPVRFPAGKGGLTRAKTLRLILEQVPTGNANFLVLPGYILVTTNDSMHPHGQFVRGVGFSRQPLDEALLELSEQSGISIVLDPRVGDKAKTPITARFPAETNVAQATRILADMADLKAVRVDAIMYVTTRSNMTAFPAEAPSSGKYTKREVAQ